MIEDYWLDLYQIKNLPYFNIGLEYENEKTPSHFKLNHFNFNDFIYLPRHFKFVKNKLVINNHIIDFNKYKKNKFKKYDYEINDLFDYFDIEFKDIKISRKDNDLIKSLNYSFLVFYSPLKSSTKNLPIIGYIKLKLKKPIYPIKNKFSISFENISLKYLENEKNIINIPSVLLSDEQISQLKVLKDDIINISSNNTKLNEENEIINIEKFDKIFNINMDLIYKSLDLITTILSNDSRSAFITVDNKKLSYKEINILKIFVLHYLSNIKPDNDYTKIYNEMMHIYNQNIKTPLNFNELINNNLNIITK